MLTYYYILLYLDFIFHEKNKTKIIGLVNVFCLRGLFFGGVYFLI